jgi:hypothetical protein
MRPVLTCLVRRLQHASSVIYAVCTLHSFQVVMTFTAHVLCGVMMRITVSSAG